MRKRTGQVLPMRTYNLRSRCEYWQQTDRTDVVARTPTSRLTSRVDAADEQRKGRPYSTAERRVPELIPVLGSKPARDVSHKPDGRLPLPSARPAVTLATLKRAATNFAAW